MTETNQDVTLYQGDKHTLRFVVPGFDDLGDPIDMTGATVRYKMMKSAKATGADIYISKVNPTEIIVNQLTDEIVCDVLILAADTESLTRFGKLYHELEFKLAGAGEYFTVSTGTPTLVRTGIRNV